MSYIKIKSFVVDGIEHSVYKLYTNKSNEWFCILKIDTGTILTFDEINSSFIDWDGLTFKIEKGSQTLFKDFDIAIFNLEFMI